MGKIRFLLNFGLLTIFLCSCNHKPASETLLGTWTSKDTTDKVNLTFSTNGLFNVSSNKLSACTNNSYSINPEKEPIEITFYNQKLTSDSTLMNINCATGILTQRYNNNFYLDMLSNKDHLKGFFEKQNESKFGKWFDHTLRHIIPPQSNEPKVVSYNFWDGFLHGVFICVSIIAKLFGFQSGWYAGNAGWTYWAGFIAGLILLAVVAKRR